jgi:hypothetical protein
MKYLLEGFEAMKDRLEGVQHLRVLGIDEGRGVDDVVGRCGAVAGPDGGGASACDIDESRGGDSSGGQGRDLYANEGVDDVVDAVFRDGRRVRLKCVHIPSRGSEGDVRRVVTLPF